MQAQVLAKIGGFGHWGSQENPLKYEQGDHTGRVIEYVDLIVEDPARQVPEVWRATLSPTVNGDRPQEGTTALCVLSIYKGRTEVVHKRNRNSGQLYETTQEPTKFRAESFSPAPSK